jgi:hypothetical protein
LSVQIINVSGLCSLFGFNDFWFCLNFCSSWVFLFFLLINLITCCWKNLIIVTHKISVDLLCPNRRNYINSSWCDGELDHSPPMLKPCC